MVSIVILDVMSPRTSFTILIVDLYQTRLMNNISSVYLPRPCTSSGIFDHDQPLLLQDSATSVGHMRDETSTARVSGMVIIQNTSKFFEVVICREASSKVKDEDPQISYQRFSFA